MSDLLNALYERSIFYDDDSPETEKERKTAMDKLIEAENKLKAKYENDPEYLEIFNEYQSAQFDIAGIADKSTFRKGFRTGAQLMIEMMRSV